ncbi:MAG: hypothetical protein BWK79_05470 [Beggiatoa sp. IS2]|nr:MAG: hypothetical protein BWK79_05470 [Beggiatoa sp. IS2]
MKTMENNSKQQFFKIPTTILIILSYLSFVTLGITSLFFIPKMEEVIPVIVNILLAIMAFWYTLEAQLLRKSADEQLRLLEKQGRLFEIQNFESTFFQLLELHLKIADNLRYDKGNAVYVGRACFAAFYAELKACYEIAFTEARPLDVSNKEAALEFEKNLIDTAFQSFYKAGNRERLGHYFRNLYNLIKFVDGREEITDKKKYMNLIRAQFSAHEEMLIFYDAQFHSHCFRTALDNKSHRLKNLIRKHELLKDVAAELFFDFSFRYETKHFALYASEFLR